MRIAYVTPHYAPFIGGVESHVIQIATRAAQRGHEVCVLTHNEPNGLPSTDTIAGVGIRRFGVPVPSRNYAVSPALWAHLAREGSRYDVVHAHGYHSLPCLAAALLKRSPLVFTPHYHGTGHSAFRKLLHPPYRKLGRLVFDHADRTIAVSPPEAELILSHFPQVRPRLVIVPNGVDQVALGDAEPFPLDQTVLLSAGRIEPYKQVDRTISALAHLPPEFALYVTGDGSARADAEAVADTLGLGGRVTFLGKVPEDELYRWFRTARVYVSMSGNEAMPVALIESLAAGARVVASDIPAHRSIAAKTNGPITLVPLDSDPAAIGAAIRRSASEDARPAQIETWDDVTSQTIEIYEDVIAQAA